MIEGSFWQSLRKQIRKRVFAFKVNTQGRFGVADVWFSGSKSDLWVENKYKNKLPPVIDMANHNEFLTLHQQQFLKLRNSEGRNVGAILGSPDGHMYFPGLSWQRQMSREEFLQNTIKTRELADLIVDLVGEVKGGVEDA